MVIPNEGIEPTQKAEGIDEFLNAAFEIDRKGAILGKTCSWCKRGVEAFRNDLSAKEYGISGMCQVCQDDTFGIE